MAQATARHILVDTEEQCNALKAKIEGGEDFATVAQEHSNCPSGREGGNLGTFGPGQMVASFDKVCFEGDVGVIHGPVKTQFGYHLIDITERS